MVFRLSPVLRVGVTCAVCVSAIAPSGALRSHVPVCDDGPSAPPTARPHDFFDAQTMDAIRHRAICLNLATHIESLGSGHSVVFHSTVRRSAPQGGHSTV